MSLKTFVVPPIRRYSHSAEQLYFVFLQSSFDYTLEHFEYR